METNGMPAGTLRALAKTLTAEARRLERAAEIATRQMESARRLARLRSIPAEIERLARGGIERQEAARLVAAALDVPVETALAYERQDRASNRRRELLRLFERGLSNRAIAERLGMHEKSVARAISRARRAAPINPQPIA